jgi:nitroreductase
MNYVELIEKRVSRRNYVPVPIAEPLREKILDLIKHFNAEYKLSITFVEDGSKAFKGFHKSFGFFKGVRSVIVMKGDKDTPHLDEILGWCAGYIIIAATRLNLGSCIVAGTYDKKALSHYIKGDERSPFVITIGQVPFELTKREKAIRDMRTDSLMSIDTIVVASDAPILEECKRGLKSMMRAPSAMGKKRVFAKMSQGEFSLFLGPGFDDYRIDLGLAKSFFEMTTGGKFSLGSPCKFLNMDILNKEKETTKYY